MKLIKGYLRTEATTDPDRELEVKTATASTGVRGTIFEVIVDDVDDLSRTRVVVEEGLVAVTDLERGTATDLGVGQSTSITASPTLEYRHEWTGPRSGRFDVSTDPGYVYLLESSSDLSFSEGEVEVLDQVSGNGSEASMSYDDFSSNALRAFFRIRRIAQ